MIFDHLNNIEFYYSLSKNLETGLRFLSETKNLESLVPGKIEIDGGNVFALVQEYDTKSFNRDMWEAHKAYFDIQFIVSGQEFIKVSRIEELKPNTPYNKDGDYWLFSGDGDDLQLKTNQFVILSPEDVHQPGLSVNNNKCFVKKIVVKALI
jgi:YhcH/YjgK/YiaL family protein